MFFAQLLGRDNFVNGGLRRFPMAELKVLIDDVRRNNPLDSVTFLGRWNFNNKGKFSYNNQGSTNTWVGKKFHGANKL